jgi:CHAT domain-containing protein
LIDLLIQQGAPLDAFLCAELAKGRAMLDSIRGRTDLAKVLTPADREETRRLNRRISEVNNLIEARQAGETSLTSLYAQLEAVRHEYQSFQDSLYVAHPNLSIREGRTPALSAGDLSQLVGSGDGAYLEYVVTKERVVLFTLTKSKSTNSPNLRVYPLAIRIEDLVGKVNEFHEMLANRNPLYPSAARELYALLLGPAEEQLRDISTICIIPDGVLWNVPFQALIDHSDRFLIEEHALYFAPSLSVLSEMNRKGATKQKANASLIAFGNPSISSEERQYADLCPLPEAEAEVSSIASNFGHGGGRFFIGREASEKAFKALVPSYAVVHLATHGVIDNKQPLFSYLLLTKSEGDPDNDGRLEAREIMDLNLHADLVILSACDTANGKISPGEGVMGMSWAFFVAGTRSMLVSQWGVNSASTSELMINFYKSLKVNQSGIVDRNAQALRGAVLTMIKDPRYRHPFNWAGFVLLGNAG